MPSSATLNHRHQPSTTSTTSSTSSTSSTRPALQRILTNSPSNAVHFSRSAAPTSRRVRSHWFTHFAFNWRRSSRTSKLFLAASLVMMALQVYIRRLTSEKGRTIEFPTSTLFLLGGYSYCCPNFLLGNVLWQTASRICYRVYITSRSFVSAHCISASRPTTTATSQFFFFSSSCCRRRKQ